MGPSAPGGRAVPRWLLAGLLAAGLAAPAWARIQIARQGDRSVHDFAGVLPAARVAALEARLSSFARRGPAVYARSGAN